jgi:hypothetical protein
MAWMDSSEGDAGLVAQPMDAGIPALSSWRRVLCHSAEMESAFWLKLY